MITRSQGRIRLPIVLLYLLAASVLSNLYFTKMGGHLCVHVDASIDQTISRPFVYRLLTPALLRAGLGLVSEDARERLATSETIGRIVQAYGWCSNDRAALMLSIYLFFFCTLATLFIWRSLLLCNEQRRSTGDPDINLVNFGPLLVLWLIPLMLFTKGAFVYDWPELLFASLLLLLYTREQWVAYYGVYVLALLNKETAILFCALPIVGFWLRREPRVLVAHLGAHIVLGAMVLFAIRFLFVGHPGSHAFNHIAENIAYFLNIDHYIKFDDSLAPGLAWPRTYNIVNILVLVALLRQGLRFVDRPFVLYLGIMFVALLPLYLFAGWEDEVRVFIPVLPMLFLALAYGSRHYLASTDGR